MKKQRISLLCFFTVFFSGCRSTEDEFVKNIKITKNENLFVTEFQVYDFSSKEENYKIRQYISTELTNLFTQAINKNKYNFRLCENIYIDAALLINDFHKIFSVITDMKIQPTINIISYIDDIDMETDTDSLIRTALYDFSEDMKGADGVISVTDKNGYNKGAVLIDDSQLIKYLDEKQWNIFNMLTGRRDGFSLTLRDNTINVVLDMCDVYYSENRITITVSAKDFKGISDIDLFKCFLENEISDCIFDLLNDSITGPILKKEWFTGKTIDVDINIF